MLQQQTKRLRVGRVDREGGDSPAFHPLTYQDWSNFPLLAERLIAGVVDVSSGLGLMLAVIGLGGAISYSVSARKRELGIRVALGARPRHLMRMILGETITVSSLGIAFGIALGAAATVLLRSQFFGIGAVEWTVLIPVGTGMLCVSLAVAYLSARPWILADPMEAVRHT